MLRRAAPAVVLLAAGCGASSAPSALPPSPTPIPVVVSPSPTPATVPANARAPFDPCTTVPAAAAQSASQTTQKIVMCRRLASDQWQWLASPTGGGTYGRGFSLYVTPAAGSRGQALIALPAQVARKQAVPALGPTATYLTTNAYTHDLVVQKDGWIVDVDVYLYDGQSAPTPTVASLLPAARAALAKL